MALKISTVFITICCLNNLIQPLMASTLIKAENSCHDPIWIAVASSPASPELSVADTGSVILPGDSGSVWVPSNWSGLVWARTHCNNSGSPFLCLTGDCGSGTIACPRGSLGPAATTAHFRAISGILGGYEFYVSAAAGYNLDVIVTPRGGTGARCGPTGDVGLLDPNDVCPDQFRVVDVEGDFVGCKAGFQYRADQVSVVSPKFACFSATYHIHFCASASPTHSSHEVDSPPLEEYNPFSPKGLGFDKEGNSKKKKGGLPWIAILVIILGVLAIPLALVINIYCNCFNGPVTNNYRVSDLELSSLDIANEHTNI